MTGLYFLNQFLTATKVPLFEKGALFSQFLTTRKRSLFEKSDQKKAFLGPSQIEFLPANVQLFWSVLGPPQKETDSRNVLVAVRKRKSVRAAAAPW